MTGPTQEPWQYDQLSVTDVDDEGFIAALAAGAEVLLDHFDADEELREQVADGLALALLIAPFTGLLIEALRSWRTGRKSADGLPPDHVEGQAKCP